jgi:hypothetical protein
VGRVRVPHGAFPGSDRALLKPGTPLTRGIARREPGACQVPIRRTGSSWPAALRAKGPSSVHSSASQESTQAATAGPCGSLAMSATSALASTTTVTLPRRSGDRVRLGPHERGLRRPRDHSLALSAAPADRVPGAPAPGRGQRRAAALPVARRPPRPQRDDDAAPRPLGARTCASPDAPCDLCSPHFKCRRHLGRQRETDTDGQL